jgi:hypothetical protein
MHEFDWSPGIGDPTIGGWLTVILYFLTMVSCWRTADIILALLGKRGADPSAIFPGWSARPGLLPGLRQWRQRSHWVPAT